MAATEEAAFVRGYRSCKALVCSDRETAQQIADFDQRLAELVANHPEGRYSPRCRELARFWCRG